MLLKIGELAKRTGLTVRTLHHYDDIGLLKPSGRSDSGYRLYDRTDVAKLYRIQALRRLDLPLSEIQAILDGGGARLPDVIDQQIAGLTRQIDQAAELRNHLVLLQERLARHDEPGLDDWLATLEIMSTYAKYFNQDDILKLRALRQQFVEAEAEKTAVTQAFRSLIDRGVPTESKEAVEIARRWMRMMQRRVGGDAGLLIKLYTMQSSEPALQALTGVDQTMLNYISGAVAYSRLEIYARHLSPEELAYVRESYIKTVTQWPALVAAVRQHMEQGSSPECPDMQELAARWLAMSQSGGGMQLQMKLREAFLQDPELQMGTGIDAAMIAFMDRAIDRLAST